MIVRLAPPPICVAAAITLVFVSGFRQQAVMAADRLWVQAGYLHVVYFRQILPTSLPVFDLSVGSAGIHGSIAAFAGLLLALTSVFRNKLQRLLRAGAFLEGCLSFLRIIQSGHVGDYVTWMVIGASVMGAAYVFLLR